MRKRRTRACPPPSRAVAVTRRVEEALELPEGALGNCARLEMAGNRRVVVEGCRGIQEYEEGLIRLSTTSGTIRFMGRGLVMNCLNEDCAVITGFLLSVISAWAQSQSNRNPDPR